MFLALIATAKANPNGSTLGPVTHFPGQGDVLTWCQDMSIGTGILLVLMGLVYLMYGFSQYKWLIAVNAAMIGMYIGTAIGTRYNHTLAGGAIGCVVAAAATLPLLKWVVAVVGGVCGAVFGAAVWKTVGLQGDLAWAGALTGLVGFGMLSFILFRGSIIMYTSLQGAMMLILGILGLAFKHPDTMPKVTQTMSAQPYLLPVLVFVPAILGLIYQQTHSGGGAGGGGGAAPPKK